MRSYALALDRHVNHVHDRSLHRAVDNRLLVVQELVLVGHRGHRSLGLGTEPTVDGEFAIAPDCLARAALIRPDGGTTEVAVAQSNSRIRKEAPDSRPEGWSLVDPHLADDVVGDDQVEPSDASDGFLRGQREHGHPIPVWVSVQMPQQRVACGVIRFETDDAGLRKSPEQLQCSRAAPWPEFQDVGGRPRSVERVPDWRLPCVSAEFGVADHPTHLSAARTTSRIDGPGESFNDGCVGQFGGAHAGQA